MTANLDLLDNDLIDEDDPRAQLWESIADGMATLSETSDAPSGVTPAASMFTSSEVDLNSDSWMSQLAEIQGWLYFDEDLPTTDRGAFLSALSFALELEPAEALDSHGTTGLLSVLALERLNQRIETASRLQQSFVEHLELEGANRATATRAWSSNWAEEETNSEPVSSDPVIATADVWPISELTDADLNLAPSYQRGDVWTTSDRQALIESVLRGIPLPSIILLETGPSTPHEVVDGKQRLTALLRFVGAHPMAIEKVKEAEARHAGSNLLSLFKTDYPAFRRAWKALESEPLTTALENAYYFPFKLRNNGLGGLVGHELEPLRGKYYSEITEAIINVAGADLTLKKLFTRTVSYKVPVILYTQASQRQIHDVFKLYNKQGVHLNAEEIRNAVYHEIEFTRAILYAAGDADTSRDVAAIARSLVGVSGLMDLGDALSAYGFGVSRYKKTKVLSWVLSLLLYDTGNENLRTTARHIDQLLTRVQCDPVDPLRSSKILADVFGWIAHSVDLHSRHPELWSEAFMDGGKGTKWQELQLVGSLVGIALAVAASPDDSEYRINTNADAIRTASTTQWARIEKAQTKTQWDYIARIAKGVVELLELDPAAASATVRDRFGSSGFESLQRMIIVTDDQR